jgi:hypothetical protein
MRLEQKVILEAKGTKIILSSSRCQGGFCRPTSENKHDRRSAPRSKFFRIGDYSNVSDSLEKVSLVVVKMKMVSVTRKVSRIEDRRQGRLFVSARLQEQ